MVIIRVSSCFLFQILVFVLFCPLIFGQLAPSESRILRQVQQLLEFPPVLQGWNNWTNFCYLPPSASLSIVCSGNHITELTVVGNKTTPSLSSKLGQGTFSISDKTLSEKFSIESFFTSLTKLSSLKVLTLVSLGLWGSLPAKINRFHSLQVLNISDNSIFGEVPTQITLMTNLRSLVLADNMLNGSVPDLSRLAVLEELNMSGNGLGPEFPSLGNKLVSIILRNNAFQCQIPSKLNNYHQLQHLDISSNQFIGLIPPKLFSLPSIRYLNLAGNKLSGALSTNISCIVGLEFVDLSNNHLTGKLPLCIGFNSSNRFMFYSWNCLSVGDLNYQHPYSFCHKAALAVKPAERQQKNGLTSKLAILLIIAGGIVATTMAIVFLLLMLFRSAKVDKVQIHTFEKSASRKASAQLSPKIPTEARHVSPTLRFGAIGIRAYHVFSLDEIEDATNNFNASNLLGEGSQGQLYKGSLRDGSVVVVRSMQLKQKYSSQRLLQHTEVISKLRHQHLVSMLGHCIVTHQEYSNGASTIFLVFEYISNSTLRNHLSDQRKREMLKWPQRLAITMGVAKGIQFLHAGIAPGIFGNDVKIENILLDENLTAKISNYDLLIPSKVGSESLHSGQDTPDHHVSDQHGEREDVYQLGAILLEVITGRSITCQRDLDVQRFQLEETLADSQLKLRGLVDPSIRGTYAYQSLRTTAEITINCLSKDPVQRPTIEDVIWNLQYSVQVQDGWSNSIEFNKDPLCLGDTWRKFISGPKWKPKDSSNVCATIESASREATESGKSKKVASKLQKLRVEDSDRESLLMKVENNV
ncbi:Receptor-like protein kinase [Thalictrum thalictroides]|uniref:non-specific serine/threonine protein kinase n=1 Tax=Thalictrum thalictroides TaxID=46969 RepID=A0A7J6WDW2_THATH|nr:Receptor-like protein kinase [Thalictrum thalictroides]